MNPSSEKRTISINPDIFKVSSSRTRRRKEPTGDNPLPKLKVRDTQLASRVNKSIKNQVLKYMRDKHRQQERGGITHSGDKSPTSVVDTFDTDFKQSLDYLNAIAEKQKTQIPKHNATLRNTSALANTQYYDEQPYSQPQTNTHRFADNSIAVETPANLFRYEPNVPQQEPAIQLHHTEYPKYGCLKNGSLPTYRMLKQQTVRINPELPTVPTQPDTPTTVEQPIIQTQQTREQESFREWMKDKIGKQKLREKRAEVEIQKRNLPKFRKLKQKKTVRRTFYLGKSENQRNVAVLISNKTLRREIANKSHQLKQTPIEEIRKCLIKKGFIKIGSTAPNDVLRKMYESISTLCGDITNHNSDNIVYNYFNSPQQEDTF